VLLRDFPIIFNTHKAKGRMSCRPPLIKLLLFMMSGDDRLTLFQVIKSILMSFFEVQKESIRKRDFEKGGPVQFIVTGIVLTVCFVLVLWAGVKFILHQAGV
jgi:hypothetical protein